MSRVMRYIMCPLLIYYHLLVYVFPPDHQIGIVNLALPTIWCSWAHSKVLIFSWQLLQDRIPTRVNLLKRGVLLTSGTISYPFYSLHIEFASSVWHRIFRWLGQCTFFSSHLINFFQIFSTSSGVLWIKGRLTIVWHAVIWLIWKSLNDIIFFGYSMT